MGLEQHTQTDTHTDRQPVSQSANQTARQPDTQRTYEHNAHGRYDHDGFHNPISDQTDSPQKSLMFEAVETLTLAAFYLNNTAYAHRAVFLLRTWFLDARTRMKPNANFAQSIPGKCDGRGIGVCTTL